MLHFGTLGNHFGSLGAPCEAIGEAEMALRGPESNFYRFQMDLGELVNELFLVPRDIIVSFSCSFPGLCLICSGLEVVVCSLESKHLVKNVCKKQRGIHVGGLSISGSMFDVRWLVAWAPIFMPFGFLETGSGFDDFPGLPWGGL